MPLVGHGTSLSFCQMPAVKPPAPEFERQKHTHRLTTTAISQGSSGSMVLCSLVCQDIAREVDSEVRGGASIRCARRLDSGGRGVTVTVPGTCATCEEVLRSQAVDRGRINISNIAAQAR